MTSTLKLIVREEWRAMYRDGRLGLSAALLLVLLGTALALSLDTSERMRSERAAAQAANREQWLDQGQKNPHTAAHYGMYVFREPSPLAFFDRGLLSYSGAGVFLEAHKQNLPVYAEARDGTLARRLGEWTAARVLGVLVPLLIAILTFGALSSERERGLLLQISSLGADLRAYAFGKFLGLGCALWLLLVPAAALGVLALTLTEGAPSHDLFARASLLGLSYLAYFAVVLAVCVAVSALSPSPRRALVILLGLWATWTLLLPRGAAELARNAHPTVRSSELEIRLAREQGLTADSPEPYEHRVESLRDRLLEQYGVERIKDLPVDFGGVVLLAGEEWGNAAFDRHLGGLHATYRAQQELLRTVSWLTPTLAVATLSMALSGSSLDDELTFIQAAEQHRRDFVRHLNEQVKRHVTTDHAYLADARLWSQIPAFKSPTVPLPEVLRRHVIELGILAVWLAAALVLLVGAAWRLERRLVR